MAAGFNKALVVEGLLFRLIRVGIGVGVWEQFAGSRLSGLRVQVLGYGGGGKSLNDLKVQTVEFRL